MTTKNQNAIIACGNTHSVAIMSDKTIRCWGDNSWNQYNTVYHYFTFTSTIQTIVNWFRSFVLFFDQHEDKHLTDVIQVYCGASHSVALLSNGTIQCWGNNLWNQCDPVHLTFTDVIQVVCNRKHSVALLSNGTVRCWGDNHWNQCDPVHLTFTDVVQVACGAKHSVALKSNGTVRCWGENEYNQCDPVHLTFTDVIQVACGCHHSVVVLSDGTVLCWG